MKQYKLQSISYATDPIECEQLLDEAAKNGFELIEIRSGGRFYFEYSVKRHDYRYYCASGAKSILSGKKVLGLEYELKRVFATHEITNKGAGMHIFRIDMAPIKERTYLNRLAEAYGMNEFISDKYLDAVRNVRNKLMFKSHVGLSVMMTIFTALFIIFGVTVAWWLALIAIAPAAVVAGNSISAIRFFKLKY